MRFQLEDSYFVQVRNDSDLVQGCYDNGGDQCDKDGKE